MNSLQVPHSDFYLSLGQSLVMLKTWENSKWVVVKGHQSPRAGVLSALLVTVLVFLVFSFRAGYERKQRPSADS